MKRILNVARLHTTVWPLIIGWPIAVLAIGFAISYTIFALIPTTDSEYNFTGAVSSMYGFAVAFYLQTVTQTFPLALGISVTRREFFTASAVVGGLQSALLATVVFVLSLIEAATDGFGVKLRMFGVLRYATDSLVLQWIGLFTTMLAVASIGLFVGVIYQRYRVNGVLAVCIAAVVAIGGGAVVVTWQRWWPEVGRFFTETPAVLLVGLIPLTVSVLFAAAGWAGLRHAPA